MPTELVSRSVETRDLFPEHIFGDYYYVDPADGDDARAGTSWQEAFQSLQAAIDASTANNGDVVYVGPGSQDVTSKVEFNKAGLTVQATTMGYAPQVKGEEFMVNADSSYTDGPAAEITQPTRIIGLGFAGRELTGESLLINSGGSGGFNGGFSQLLNCRFPTWYGAIDAGIRTQGGQYNYIEGCTFDGLFVGFDVAAIIQETSGNIDPGFTRVKGCEFSGVGSGKHCIKHDGKVLGLVYKSNMIDGGFTGNEGKFLDNNNTASTGVCADNWLAPLANQGAAFENLTNSEIGFADNHYEEA